MTSPLVSAEWLESRLGSDDLVIADVRWYLDEPERGFDAYRRSHIPGASYFHLEEDLSADSGPGRHPLPDPTDFVATLGSRGISSQSRVICYDDRGGAVAARLWWMLEAIDHPGGVQVLDGGLTTWESHGFPTVAGVEESDPVDYRVDQAVAFRGIVDAERLEKDPGRVALLDARSPERYLGEEEPIDPVAGHIPTAINAFYGHNLADDLRFKASSDLKAHYESLGVGDASGVVAYCGSGVTACHDLLAMTVAGLGRGYLYPGSWSDWGTSGRDVVGGPLGQ